MTGGHHPATVENLKRLRMQVIRVLITRQPSVKLGSVDRGRGLQVDLFPLSPDDPLANLNRGLSFSIH